MCLMENRQKVTMTISGVIVSTKKIKNSPSTTPPLSKKKKGGFGEKQMTSIKQHSPSFRVRKLGKIMKNRENRDKIRGEKSGLNFFFFLNRKTDLNQVIVRPAIYSKPFPQLTNPPPPPQKKKKSINQSIKVI